jgi:hypothetical protein
MSISEPIPIRPGIEIESNTFGGTFACKSSFEDGPPERGVDYEKEGRSFSCNYCLITLSTS